MADTNKSKPATQPLSLKEKQREERVALIREAAYALLNEKGYYDTSMDEIAARVGISKGTLYLHFKSKEELVFNIVDEEINRFFLIVDEIMQRNSSVQSRLEQILLESYNRIQGGRQLLLAFRPPGLNKDVLQDHLEAQSSMAGLLNRFTHLFEAGKLNGEFDSSVPTSVMVSVFLGLLQLYSNEQMEINQIPPEQLLPSVSRLLFHGLLAKS